MANNFEVNKVNWILGYEEYYHSSSFTNYHKKMYKISILCMSKLDFVVYNSSIKINVYLCQLLQFAPFHPMYVCVCIIIISQIIYSGDKLIIININN